MSIHGLTKGNLTMTEMETEIREIIQTALLEQSTVDFLNEDTNEKYQTRINEAVKSILLVINRQKEES
jgi:hypothetical protein